MTGVEAMDYTANDRSVLMLMNLTTLLEYKEVQAVPIALESEGEDLENRIKVVMDKVEQLQLRIKSIRRYENKMQIFEQ
ncbi:unnamed protein product [Rhizopus stolonifer]